MLTDEVAGMARFPGGNLTRGTMGKNCVVAVLQATGRDDVEKSLPCRLTSSLRISWASARIALLLAIPLRTAAGPAAVTGTVNPAMTSVCERYVQTARVAYRTAPYQSYTNTVLDEAWCRSGLPRGIDPQYAQPAAGTIRWHQVEGTANFRDVGGWNGLKTGLVFRGAEPNCKTNPAHFAEGQKASHDLYATASGLRYLSETLRIRTDLDLRGRGESPTPDETPIPGAQLLRCPVGSYAKALAPAGLVKMSAALHVFAKEENYPIYFHCYGGADRTGTLAFLLEGLCGVDEADLAVDYELTTFGLGRRPRVDGPYFYASLVREVKKRPGRTLKEKIEHLCLNEMKFTPDEIATIRRMLLAQ